ncbi:MAG TPA: glycosyltransferase family 2 protein, partial [Polyangiales bacterium]|nr:glycosyltransferase family 2 protein [Polyangiales bacterium]
RMPAIPPLRSIDIVVPVFNEEACIQQFYERTLASISPLPYAFRILFIDDGSRDRSAELCLALSRVDPRVGLLRFSRNFGHQAALTAGLDVADADAVITMDADLQHPPERLPDFIAAWEQGAEIVSGVRANAAASAWKRLTSSAFYRVLNAISPYSITPDSPDFRLFDAKVVNAIRRVREQSRFLRGIYAWVGFRQVEVRYDEAERAGGVTHYSTLHMLMFALRAVLSFSHLPLRLATYFGLCVSLLAFLFGMYAVIMNVVFHHVVPGWTSLAVLVSFLSGVQLLTLGVLGEYLGQVLEESKRRPLYLIAETYMPSLRTSVPPPASPLPHG